ncbi:MAG: tyrosine recombinase [bacterium]
MPGYNDKFGSEKIPEDWLDYLQQFKNKLYVDEGLAKNTIEAYLSDLRDFLKFCSINGVKLSELDSSLLTDYLENCHSRYALRTISRRVASLNRFLSFLKNADYLKNNPVQLLDRPSGAQKFPDYLDEQEIEALLEAPDTQCEEGVRARALLEIFYGAGLRVSEVAELKSNNINWERGEMLIEGKGSKQRLVPVGKTALKWMKRYAGGWRRRYDRSGTDYFFINKKGKQISRQKIWEIVKTQAGRARLSDVSPHTLRHTFATHMLSRGADLRSLQEMLGHSDVATTAGTYVHLRDEVRRAHNTFHPRGGAVG